MSRAAPLGPIVVALCLAACTVGPGSGTAGPATTTGPSGEGPSTTVAVTTSPTATGPPACLSGDAEFADEGVFAAFGSGSGDAGIVSGLRWTIAEVCERFVVDLATEGGSPAATVGRTTVELRPEAGILRITLPGEVSTSAVSRTVVDGRMVAAAYAVALVDGGLAIDLHLDALSGVQARAFLATSPARIVVDLQPVAAAPPVTPPAASAATVLLTPRRGPAAYPLDVVGYVAPHLDAVTATLGAGERGAADLDPDVAASDHVWREFTARADDGPAGSVDLTVVATRDSEPVDELSVSLDIS